MGHAKGFRLLDERNLGSEGIMLVSEKILELTSKSRWDNDGYIGNPRPYHALKRQAYHGASMDDDEWFRTISSEFTQPLTETGREHDSFHNEKITVPPKSYCYYRYFLYYKTFYPGVLSATFESPIISKMYCVLGWTFLKAMVFHFLWVRAINSVR